VRQEKPATLKGFAEPGWPRQVRRPILAAALDGSASLDKVKKTER
jgi:hypothetical protein